jgi:hypothetical protein
MKKLYDHILFIGAWIFILIGIPLLFLAYIRLLAFIAEKLGMDFWK